MRVLLRAGKAPDVVLSPEASLASNAAAVFASNSGNLLFSSSVHRALSVPGTTVVADSLRCERSPATEALAAEINEQFDVLVLPLANAFRPSFTDKLDKLARLITLLDIPVVVVGVGAQLDVEGDVHAAGAEVDASTRAFVQAVLDKSATIGVRGEMTQRYLVHLGFEESRVDVIGCPSLYDAGTGLEVQKKVAALDASSKVVVNTGQLVPGAGEFVQRATAAYPESHFVGQSRHELALLLWGQPIRQLHPGLAGTTRHPLFVEDRLRFFVDASTWVDYMRTRDFAVGGRIHGNVAALLAGTPAVPLAWDSRIRELAEYHAIPYEIAPSLAGDLDLAAIYERADFTELNRRVPENLARYAAFLERNGLAHTGQPGQENPAYDQRMAKLAFPGPIGPPTGPDGIAQLLDRLRWLRQDAATEKARRHHGYVPPFGVEPLSQLDEIRALKREVAELSARLDSLDGLSVKAAKKLRAALRRDR